MSRFAALAWSIGAALVVVAVDQLTKAQISDAFTLYQIRPVIDGFFNLTYITNTGAAFGIMARSGGVLRAWVLCGVAVLALVALVFAWRHLWASHYLYSPSIGMVAGGAVGNLIDRVRLGAVIDFLDFYLGKYHWPAFNVADSAITVGVFLFILAGILEKEDGTEVSRPEYGGGK